MIREYASQELGSIREMWMNDENLRSEEHFLFQLLQYIDRHSDSKHQLVFQLRSPRKSEFHEDIEIDTLVARVEEVSNESITLVVSHDSMSETVVKLVEGSGSDGHYQFISGNRGEFKKLKDHIQASIRMFDSSTRSQVSHIHDYRLYLHKLSLLQQKFDSDVDSGTQVDEDVMNDFLRLLNQANSQVYESQNLQAVLSFESTPNNGEQERRSWVHDFLLRLFLRASEDDKNN